MIKTLLPIIPLLSACTIAVPVERHFPNVPLSLEIPCSELTELTTEDTKLSDLLDVVTENYGKYHNCKLKNELWLKWYSDQKENFEDLN